MIYEIGLIVLGIGTALFTLAALIFWSAYKTDEETKVRTQAQLRKARDLYRRRRAMLKLQPRERRRANRLVGVKITRQVENTALVTTVEAEYDRGRPRVGRVRMGAREEFDNPLLAASIAFHRATGMDFIWPWRCLDEGCSRRGGLLYSQSWACRDNDHTITEDGLRLRGVGITAVSNDAQPAASEK